MGASGLLLKDAAVAELVTCIKQVSNGSKYLPKELISAPSNAKPAKRIELRHIEELSGRSERYYSCWGRPANKEIAVPTGFGRRHCSNSYAQ